jgi:hypothetical protein
MALTTAATMRTAIGSVPISINIDARPEHADGGWARPYRRPWLRGRGTTNMEYIILEVVVAVLIIVGLCDA